MGKRLLSLAEQLDDATLKKVFTHTSWASERGESYERLEFLGDSVLSLSVTTELYRRFPAFSEGHLARLRAYVVSRATCAKVATKLGLGRMLREHAGVADGEAAQLMSNTNVLADLTEALIGALYITFGYEAVRPAVVDAFSEHITFAEQSYVDHKTELQEYGARLGSSVAYRLVATVGPPHHREFEIEATVDGEVLGRGIGTSKKRAEQEAAAEALAELQDRARRSRRRPRLRSRRKAGELEGDPAVPDAVVDDEDLEPETPPRTRRPARSRGPAIAASPPGSEDADSTPKEPPAKRPTRRRRSAKPAAPDATGQEPEGQVGPAKEPGTPGQPGSDAGSDAPVASTPVADAPVADAPVSEDAGSDAPGEAPERPRRRRSRIR